MDTQMRSLGISEKELEQEMDRETLNRTQQTLTGSRVLKAALGGRATFL